MTLHLAGIGTATPRHSITQHAAARIASTLYPGTEEYRTLLPVLYRQTGIQQRGSVLLNTDPEEHDRPQSFFAVANAEDDFGPTTAARMAEYERHSILLATQACFEALEKAQINGKRVTHLVTVSCSGFSAPGFDIALFDRLGLSPETSRTHVGFMGCHGAFNGLRVANAYLRSDPKAVVLLCAVEICTIHHQYSWRRDQLVANALFADGAAAVVCTADGDDADMVCLKNSSSTLVPDTSDAMGWYVRDHGFEMTLSPEVPVIIEQHLDVWLTKWLTSQGTTKGEIGAWAIHPGGPRILKACATSLALDDSVLEPSQAVLAKHGNMSSPTILFILNSLQQQYAPLPWVAMAFGPGLTIEAALFDAADA